MLLFNSKKEEDRLKVKLESGQATFEEGMRLYHLITSRGEAFPLSWEEAVLKLALHKEPGRPDLVSRLHTVLRMQGKSINPDEAGHESCHDREDTQPEFSMLMVSVPKSGTVYMNKMLMEGLGLENFIMSNRYFPEDQLYLDAIETFRKGGYYVAAHIDASPMNLQILKEFVPKWVVHFRDPRSVLLSWVHHVARLAANGQFMSLMQCAPVPPKELHERDFEYRVDWHIEHFLPAVTTWMLDWLDAAHTMPDRILVTEFKLLKENEKEFAYRIFDFLGIKRTLYIHQTPEKTIGSHFRSGRLAEWRESFTQHQMIKIGNSIPAGLLERFGWPPE